MRIKRWLGVVLLMLSVLAVGQRTVVEKDTQTIVTSGSSIVFQDTIGSQANQFEMVVVGGPATVTVNVFGCMRSNTCSASLATSSSTTNVIIPVTGGPYDYYKVTGSWTGGGTVTLTFNRTGSSARSNSGGAASSVAFSGVTNGTNTNTLVEGAAGSLSPTANGQIADTQAWLLPGFAAPAAASSNSGGSLPSGHATVIAYTLNSALGETLPSAEIAANNIGGFGAGCTSGSSCSITVTAPAIPSGYTGYTVYSKDCATLNPCTGGLKQTVSSACVNISINCVIQVGGAGANYPTTNTAIVTPPSVQAGFVPLGGIASWFFSKTNGQYFPLAGMDFSNGNPLLAPDGTLEFWHRLFITDSGQNLNNATQAGGGLIRDALVSIGHLSGNATATGSGIDDRVLALRGTDSPTSPTYGQWLGVYGEQFTYNNNFLCSPVGTAMVQEDCVAAIRARANDQRTAGVNNIWIIGVHGTASTNVAAPKLGSCSPCVAGIVGTASQETVSNQNGAAAAYVGVVGSILASAGNTNGTGYDFWAKAPSTRFATQNGGLFIDAFSNAADFGIRSDATAKSYFKGAIDLDSINPLNNGTIPMGGSVKPMGVGTQQLSSIQPSISNIGVAGAVAYSYKAVFKDVNGTTAAASTVANTATGNATLNGSNFNRVQFWSSASSQVLNCPSTIDVYRTASSGTPASVGKIGTFTVTDCTAFYNSQQFDDTGLAGDTTTPPTVNNTGSVQAFNYQTNTNCAATGSAASPSVAACGAAAAGSFSCATNAVNTCTVNTTAVTANSEIFISQREDTTTGTRLGVTCNTTASAVVAEENITAVVAGTSFSFGLTQPVTNPDCFSYLIINQ